MRRTPSRQNTRTHDRQLTEKLRQRAPSRHLRSDKLSSRPRRRPQQVFELIGVAGVVISVLAYLPQVAHLARQRCSAGVSGRAWAMWLASSLMMGIVAFHHHDPVFILLQVSTLVSAAVIVFLVHRYRGMICATHALAAREAARARLGTEV